MSSEFKIFDNFSAFLNNINTREITASNATISGQAVLQDVNVLGFTSMEDVYIRGNMTVQNSMLTSAFTITEYGPVGIGTTEPSTSALLDIKSTTKGFLPPRMTTDERSAISTPEAGLVVYNSTLA